MHFTNFWSKLNSWINIFKWQNKLRPRNILTSSWRERISACQRCRKGYAHLPPPCKPCFMFRNFRLLSTWGVWSCSHYAWTCTNWFEHLFWFLWVICVSPSVRWLSESHSVFLLGFLASKGCKISHRPREQFCELLCVQNKCEEWVYTSTSKLLRQPVFFT